MDISKPKWRNAFELFVYRAMFPHLPEHLASMYPAMFPHLPEHLASRYVIFYACVTMRRAFTLTLSLDCKSQFSGPKEYKLKHFPCLCVREHFLENKQWCGNKTHTHPGTSTAFQRVKSTIITRHWILI